MKYVYIVDKRVSWTVGRMRTINWEEISSLDGDYELIILKLLSLTKILYKINMKLIVLILLRNLKQLKVYHKLPSEYLQYHKHPLFSILEITESFVFIIWIYCT